MDGLGLVGEGSFAVGELHILHQMGVSKRKPLEKYRPYA